MANEAKTQPYQLFTLALSVFALVLLAVSVLIPLDDETHTLITYADNAICGLFFIDFLILFYRAENKFKYFFTWGWLDLLSSIPMIEALRLGRASRIVRLFRVLRGLRAARVFTMFAVEKRAESGLLTAALIIIVLIVVSSIAVLHFETDEGNIKTAGDALWWSLTTVTTVGYGDRYPVTVEGKVIAVLLMFAGIGLFGVLSGLLAAWFTSPSTNKQDSELKLLREELAGLKQVIASLSEGISNGTNPSEPP